MNYAMAYQTLINKASYEKELKEMDGDELEREYFRIITTGNIAASSYHLKIIREQYKQLTGESIENLISKTA